MKLITIALLLTVALVGASAFAQVSSGNCHGN